MKESHEKQLMWGNVQADSWSTQLSSGNWFRANCEYIMTGVKSESWPKFSFLDFLMGVSCVFDSLLKEKILRKQPEVWDWVTKKTSCRACSHQLINNKGWTRTVTVCAQRGAACPECRIWEGVAWWTCGVLLVPQCLEASPSTVSAFAGLAGAKLIVFVSPVPAEWHEAFPGNHLERSVGHRGFIFI